MTKRKKVLLAIVGIFIALAVCYVVVSIVFQNRFLPNTTINGTDVSHLTLEEAEQTLKAEADNYVLTIKERDGAKEQITTADIGMELQFGDTLEQLLESQNGFAWLVNLFRGESLEAEKSAVYDEERFETVTSALNCLDEGQMTDSVNASLTAYDPETGYEMVPAVYGTRLDAAAVKSLISTAVTELREELDLEAEGCYADPAYDENSDAAQNMLAKANQYVGTTVTYTFGDSTEILDGATINQWIVVGDDLSVTLDTTKMEEYVAGLAEKYNTSGKSKSLKTSYGTTVTISGGSYGWKINQEETCTALSGYLEAGENYTGDVSYSRTAASHGTNDYGNTYVEINITGQHLWFYKNGSLVVESDFVSGNLAKGYGTPNGAYSVSYKQKDAVLKGQGYASPVSFWMPFNGGIGLHDASWRSTFGGTIYKTNGSHGCINLPYSVAKKIYENISAGDPVLVYTLAGTEQATKDTSTQTTTETETTTTEENTSTETTETTTTEGTAGTDSTGTVTTEETTGTESTETTAQ